MRYIGLDVHKDNIAACVLTSTGKPKFEKNFIKESESWNLSELMDYGDKDGFCVMMDSGTYAGTARRSPGRSAMRPGG